MKWLHRISGYQFVAGWLAFMAAFALACAIWPELDRLATALSDPALYLGLLLAAGYLGWTAWVEIWKAHRHRKTAGRRGQVRR